MSPVRTGYPRGAPFTSRFSFIRSFLRRALWIETGVVGRKERRRFWIWGYTQKASRRLMLTGWAVPSSWAKVETRNSSSIQRKVSCWDLGTWLSQPS
jgi:hypothetical protein